MSIVIKEATVSEFTEVEVLSTEIIEPVIENAGPVIKIEPERYGGDYEVIPKVTEQSLETANKFMERDVLVNEIPKFETSNASGGTTVYIGSEV